eukprot:2883261-Rhodomonas_salina.1
MGSRNHCRDPGTSSSNFHFWSPCPLSKQALCSTFVPEYNSHRRTRYDLRKRTFLGRRYGLRDFELYPRYPPTELVAVKTLLPVNFNRICDSLSPPQFPTQICTVSSNFCANRHLRLGHFVPAQY